MIKELLHEEFEIKEKFEELKLLTGCPDSYLNELEKEVSELPITLSNLIDKKIYNYKNIYNKTLEYQCEKVRELLNQSCLIDRLIYILKLDKFANWLERKLRNRLIMAKVKNIFKDIK
jgi:hypothetical protein